MAFCCRYMQGRPIKIIRVHVRSVSDE
jgi:hypothetical protein